MRHLLPCPPCGRQGRPGQGFLAGSNTSEPRGSAPRERDHRGGDHPVPSRTRQLSPPSPRVLQREAAGGQGVALAEGAFSCAQGAARRARREGPRGDRPLRAFACLGEVAAPRAALRAPPRDGCRSAARRSAALGCAVAAPEGRRGTARRRGAAGPPDGIAELLASSRARRTVRGFTRGIPSVDPCVSVNIVFTIFANVFSPIAPTHMRRFRQCRCAAFGA